MDSGPTQPPCPILLRIADRERRCDNLPMELPGEKVDIVLMSPTWSNDCRLLLRNHRNSLVKFDLVSSGDGTARGSLGPFKRNAAPYVLSFVALDERRSVAETCGAYGDVRIELSYPPLPVLDAGLKDP